MLGRTLATAVVAAFMVAVPMAGYAASSGSAVVHQEGDEDYTPGLHSVPSLDGTVVGSECIGDVPYIGYSVVLNDPDNQVTSHEASLIITGGGNTTTIALGTLDSSNRLTGRVLWPGASVDASGNATGWPGYEFVNGAWVQTSGNFAWTRGPITAVIQVNPELTVPLSYPPATAVCASPPSPSLSSVSGSPASEDNPALAATGSTIDPAPLLLAGGALVVVGGLAVILVARRAARRQ
jgi:hypothetical protein